MFIAINTALQVFKPHPVKSGHGGLYPYRYAVYAFVFTVPFILSALAFINKQTVGAYLSQGPTCSLPIRPFWYRLALSWIPRYVIIIVVLALYIAIYVHAERQFVDYRPFHRKLSAAVFVYPSKRSTSWFRKSDWLRPWRRKRTTKNVKDANASFHLDITPPQAPLTASTLQAPSEYAITEPPTSPALQLRGNSDSTDFALSQAPSARSSVVPYQREEIESPGNSVATESTLVAGAPTSPMRLLRLPTSLQQQQQHEEIQEQARPTLDENYGENIGWRDMRKKHRTIRRQLRLQFVYPVIYFASWMAPFASHLSMYDTAVAQHPIFPLVVIGFASLALMPIVDVFVFSIRERPWRHIPGTDGTVLGSFVFWKTVARRERRVSDSLNTSSATSSDRHPTTDTLSSVDSDSSTVAGSRRPSALRIVTRSHGQSHSHHRRSGQTQGTGTTSTILKSTVAGAGAQSTGPGTLGSPLQTIPSIDDVSSGGGARGEPHRAREARAASAELATGVGGGGDALGGLRHWDFGGPSSSSPVPRAHR